MALDLVLPRGRPADDESLASFVGRRLGREALERVAQPLVSGIYTADPDRLSLAATMPRFLEMERRHRSVILGMLQQPARPPLLSDAVDAAPGGGNDESGARWSLFVSLDDGMQRLVDTIAARLPRNAAHLGAAVATVAVGAAAGEWRVVLANGEVLEADAVVLATPAHVTAQLLRDLDPVLANELAGIPYASSATVTLAYRRVDIPHQLDGFGFVVPLVERRRIIACTFSSVKYPGRAPADAVLLRTFAGGALQASMNALDDAALEAAVRSELGALLGISAPPLLVRVHRHPEAMPQYHVGHLARVASIEQRLARHHPGLIVAGNAYRGVGIPDCVRSGEGAAETALALLAPITPPASRPV
jgi:oxygen-dependent protoporphyrinogen oxidase